ncbi:GNAT family N-acetyltransferase [Bacillaceae bacterium S4-13-58]
MLNIRVVQSATELEDAYHVRRDVFVMEQKVPESIEIDDHDRTAIHFVGYADQRPVSAGRMRFVDNYAKLERVSVMKPFRGHGYGKQLILEMEKIAKEKGYTQTKLNAQDHAEEFYRNLGYHTISKEPFMDAGIPHVTMIKDLTKG